MIARLLAAFALVWLFAGACFAQTQRTDLNLVIAMDCSWSVDDTEFALQLGGVSAALSDPEVIASIKGNLRGRIAITIIHWSTSGIQKVALPWTVISGESDAVAVARATASLRRQTRHGGTSIAGALRFGQNLLLTAPFPADRYIIDVIADGENNNGDRIERVRDEIVAQGTTINALGIINVVGYLHHYLRNRVIGGSGAFVEKALDYQDFRRAFRKKLLREIRGEQITGLPVRRAAFR